MTEEHPEKRAGSAAPMPAAVVGLVVATMAIVFAALLFVPAGRLDWTLGWIYVGIIVATIATNRVCLVRWNPELIERRMRLNTLRFWIVPSLPSRDPALRDRSA